MTNERRLQLEHQVLNKLVRHLLSIGATLSVFDGEEITVSRSTDAGAIVEALRTTDEDWLNVHLNGRTASVFLVYGNDPWEVICDHSVSLTEALEPVQEYAASLQEVR